MNYYEELGLSETASPDQIHQAYRQFARLIHPDQQPDDRLRVLAEIQMKRLNRMIEVLSDPARRRDYDRSLDPPMALVLISPQSPAPGPGILSKRLNRVNRSFWVWAGAAFVGVAIIAVFFSDYEWAGSVPVPKVYAEPHPPPVLAPSLPVEHAEVARNSLPHHSRGLLPPLPPRQESRAELPPQPDIWMDPAQDMLHLPIPRLDKPAGLAGHWLYASVAGVSKTERLYAPEFIEMKISESEGQVAGTYRARYLVTDKAISSAVAFHFEGRAAVPLSTLHWIGAGGAYGRITLKLISENSLTVNWTAEHLSEDIALISGKATLARRRDPQ
jgi:hypothetical protein